ncbi:HD domain-containing phosphohydrolase [Sandarakinorhabdus cyanobacteriorum]|nr:HD domain-containing phosphohydrolase [Sandarakinorhabdus cyanobacteriorum]
MPQTRTQPALAKSLANDLIANMADVVMVVTYPGFELIYANAAGHEQLAFILGRSDLAGLNLRSALDKSVIDRWNEYFDRTLATGSCDQLHTGVKGRSWHLRLQREPRQGPCTAITITATDMTALASVRDQLQNSDLHYRTLFETMSTGVVYHQADGRVIRVNPAAEAILGYKEADMIGWSPLRSKWDVIREDGSVFAGAEHPIMEVVRTGIGVDNQLLGIPHPDGRRRWIRLSGRPVRRTAGDAVENLVVCFQDVTEQQELRQQTIAQMRQLDRALEQTLLAMAEMIEMRDPYTAGHQQNVAQLADRIAREMGLGEDRCRMIRLAALVHDIGKNAIPIDLLVKPTGLSPLEFDMVKQHVEAGYHVLSRIEFAQPVADIMRQHHERLDGSGYPHGLAGDQILLEARILAVADTVDAMVNHRPYRAARGMPATLALLEQSAGAHYDPDVVAAFKRTVQAG